MTIKTSLELVRYIRHHIAGSEFQDVKAVEEFVDTQIGLAWAELRDILKLPSTDNDKLLVLQEVKQLKEFADESKRGITDV